MYQNSINRSFSGNDHIKDATGKTLAEWILILDADLAFDLNRSEIAARLQSRYKVGTEWASEIANSYCEAMGVENETAKPGGLDVTITLTINASLQLVEQAFTEQSLLNSWLNKNLILVKHNPGRNLKFDFSDQVITVNLTAKGPSKCQVGLNHARITEEKALDEKRSFWKEALSDLAALVEKNDNRN